MANARARWLRARVGARKMVLLLCVVALSAVVVAYTGGTGSKGPGGNDLGSSADSTGGAERSYAGKAPAPAIPTGVTWFNVQQPLTLQQLKGKVVLLDFWTLGCINCQHIIPDLKKLEDEFGNQLVVIGVHSGKYSTEHDDQSIKDAIKKYGLEHPVLNDPDFVVWNTFGANAWPTLALIDPAGNYVGNHAGEGVYPLFEPIIQSLTREFSAKGLIDETPVPLALDTTAAATVLAYPGKVLADAASGRLFIADSGHNRILVADLEGRLQKAFGDGKEGFADGSAAEAEFRQPQGLGLSGDGKTLYVADTRNHAVRAVDLASGNVKTIAGTGFQLDQLPKPGAKATATALASPWDLVAVGQTLYIAMAGVHQLWAVDLLAGTISVFAGTSREGLDDGPRAQATLAQPSGITTDGTTLYWVDPESSSVRRVALAGNGNVETIVGTGLFDYGDEDGKGTAAKLQHAQGIAWADGALYVGDTYNHKLRIIDPATKQAGTAAGSGERGWGDGVGAAAKFDEPGGIGYADGRVYVADTNNQLIRVFEPASGRVSTLTLTNLAVAATQTPGAALQVGLPPQTVAPGASNLRVTLTTPAGYHLNSQAPSKLTLSASNPAVAELGETTLLWATDDGSVSLPVPVALREGTATLTGTASIYYCRTGGEALCFIQQVELSLPLTVATGASAAEPQLSYLLPGVPG